MHTTCPTLFFLSTYLALCLGAAPHPPPPPLHFLLPQEKPRAGGTCCHQSNSFEEGVLSITYWQSACIYGRTQPSLEAHMHGCLLSTWLVRGGTWRREKLTAVTRDCQKRSKAIVLCNINRCILFS